MFPFLFSFIIVLKTAPPSPSFSQISIKSFSDLNEAAIRGDLKFRSYTSMAISFGMGKEYANEPKYLLILIRLLSPNSTMDSRSFFCPDMN
jgi:hypothetical protein